MKERKLTIDIKKANYFGVALLAVTALATVAAAKLIWGDAFSGKMVMHTLLPASDGSATSGEVLLGSALIFVALLVGIVVHELIHGIVWAVLVPGGWKSISFGVKIKELMPYCHCSEPLVVRHYLMGALAPLVVLGIVPLVAGVALCSVGWMAFGILFVAAAGGDIMVSWLLRSQAPTAKVLDHPSEPGCIIYEEA
ncbi:MAG: DUF3267 domain-containing protein [Bacteroidales bacterium]|nr:DUF3267 domain-containing protein [Bacteroidales bacterium]